MSNRLKSFLMFAAIVVATLLCSALSSHADILPLGIAVATAAPLVYPKIVQKIHNDFYNSHQELLDEYHRLEEHTDPADKLKTALLKQAGFKITKDQVKKEAKPKYSFSVLNTAMELFGQHKFISIAQVDQLCKKYSLLCLPIENFTGFVPNKNLSDITEFIKNHSGYSYPIKGASGIKKVYQSASDGELNCIITRGPRNKHDEKTFYKHFPDGLVPHNFIELSYNQFKYDACIPGELRGIYLKGSTIYKFERSSLFICASKKDFGNTGPLTKFGSMMGIVSTIPDPVVLCPHKDGWVIVTAWGDEASDPLVVNEQMN